MASTKTVMRKLTALYGRMEAAYAAAAEATGLTCDGCPDNCCVSFFQHHTYVEWVYLWEGLKALPEERRRAFVARAETYLADARALLGQGLRPRLMCPLNEDGRCGLYGHRLMICRLHGVVNGLTRPDGQRLSFPGCFRCQELTEGRADVPVLDRTPLYRDLAALEMELLGSRRGRLPKVDLTLAEMLVQGPPRLS